MTTSDQLWSAYYRDWADKMQRVSALRSLFIGVAAIIGFWAVTTFSVFWTERKIDKIGARIAAGELFKRAALEELQPQLDYLETRSFQTPEALHNTALIELRRAELELETGNKIAGNAQFARAQNAIETTLRAVPSDGFMWFALFWLIKTRDGLREEIFPYLRMSYLVGPHEGWIAARRNRLTVPLLSILPKDLSDIVLVEFENLVSYGYVDAAADILTGPGQGNRDLLFQALSASPDYARRNLADALYTLGFDIPVQGVKRGQQRPWR